MGGHKKASMFLLAVVLMFLLCFSMLYYALYTAFINVSERLEWMYYIEGEQTVFDATVHALVQNIWFYLPVFAIIGLIIYAWHYTLKKKRSEMVFG